MTEDEILGLLHQAGYAPAQARIHIELLQDVDISDIRVIHRPKKGPTLRLTRRGWKAYQKRVKLWKRRVNGNDMARGPSDEETNPDDHV